MTSADLPSTLVTVTTTEFLPGTRVMLASFLRRNRWFDGEIIVVTPTVYQAEAIKACTREFERLHIRIVSQELAAAIATLVAAYPNLANRAARFLSLECFWVGGGNSILYCDSDLLFLRDISEGLTTDGEVLACPDRSYLMNDKNGLSFNAGMMLLRPAICTEETRQQVLARLDPNAWRSVRTDHTDQAVLNAVLSSRVTLLGQSYNRLIGHAIKLRSVAEMPLHATHVLHFNGPAKPWQIDKHIDAARQSGEMVKGYQLWFEAHCQNLARMHLEPLQPV